MHNYNYMELLTYGLLCNASYRSPQISMSVTVPCMVVLNCASTNQEALSVPVTLVTSSTMIHNVEVSG